MPRKRKTKRARYLVALRWICKDGRARTGSVAVVANGDYHAFAIARRRLMASTAEFESAVIKRAA